MLKKFFLAAFFMSVTIFATASAQNPRSDENLVVFYRHQGYEYLLKKDTLELEECESPQIISFRYVVYDSRRPERTDWGRENEMAFAYDVEARKVYFVNADGSTRFLNPKGTTAEGSGYAAGAEIVYYLVLGEKFYGTYDEDFYSAIND